MTWAGSWPDPDPWMTETLSSLGASARMIRLYSGTYLSVSGLASAMPLSISGTNWRGSLTNFFICHSLRILRAGRAALPFVGQRLEHHCDGDRASVERADAPLAGVAGPPAHGLHGPGCLGPLPGRAGRGAQDVCRGMPKPNLLLDRVDGRYQRVQQRLVADIGAAAGLDAPDGRPQHRDDLLGLHLGRRARRRARAQERGAPERPGRAADPAGDDDRDLLQERADVRAVEGVPVPQHQLEPARHGVAEVAVTDDGVQVTEVLLVGHGCLRDREDDDLNVAEGCCGHNRSWLSGTESSWTEGAGSTRARSARVIQSPGRSGLELASTVVCSPPGSPSADITSAASLKSCDSVKSLTVITHVRPAPAAASRPLRESSITTARSAGTASRSIAS